MERCADIISNVINRAQNLRPEFIPSAPAQFNIPSTGSNYESQYINKRRAEKLKKLGNNFAVINPFSEAIPDQDLNPTSDNMNPIEQIQHTNKLEIKSQFAHVISPFGTSSSNVLGLHMSGFKISEVSESIVNAAEDKDNEIVFDSDKFNRNI